MQGRRKPAMGSRSVSGPPGPERHDQPRRPAAEIAAVILSLLWLGAVLYWLPQAGDGEPPPGGAWQLMVAAAVILPIAVLWVGALVARNGRIMREEADRLAARLDALYGAAPPEARVGGDPRRQGTPPADRAAPRAAPAASPPPTPQGPVARAPSPVRGGRSPSADGAAADLHDAATPGPAAGATGAQPRLALGTGPEPPEGAPLPVAAFIRAINFPATPDDREGFRILREALADHRAARLIRAAEDVLTLLSQEGIYMDELDADPLRPELWRRFAQGERGRAVAGLGAVHDREALEAVTARMRTDPVFRDAMHHFLRQFDITFQAFEPRMSDAEILAMSDTRTARAFMLLGRAAGTFD